MNCVYRGEQYRQIKSHLAPKNDRRQPVHACELYGACTLIETEHALKSCVGCGDRREDHLPKDDMDEPYRFVTALTEEYVPGFLALVQSLIENSGIPFRFTVILYGPLSEESGRLIDNLAVDIEFVPKHHLGEFVFDRSKSVLQRMAPNLDKILMWRLPYDERCMYLDSDIICLNSLAGVQHFPSLSVALKQSSLGENPDHDGSYKPSGRYPFNCGVMIFKPNEDVFDAIQEYASRNYPGQIRYGDQVIHNDFFASQYPEMVHHISQSWNCSVFVRTKWPNLWESMQVRLLHFACNEKPWVDEVTDWRSQFWSIWRGFYERAVVS